MRNVEKHSIYADDIRKLSNECQYLILSSVRGTGKSFASKKFVLDNFIENNNEFIYLRRTKEEIKDIDVIDYFADMDIHKLTDGQYDCIDVFRKRIYLCNIVKDKVVRSKKIGYTIDLMHYQDKKSLQYPNVTCVIYEEYCTDKYYLDNEPSKLQDFLSTIFRDRKGFCILIGNKINRFNPYFLDWDLRNAPCQQIGTIDTYTIDETETTIKIWDIKKVEKTSKMFFGNAKKSIDGNEYIVNEHRKLENNISDYTKIYEIIVECQQLAFYARCLLNNYTHKPIWYIEPKTSEIFYDTDRVISDNPCEKLLHTQGFKALSEKENLLFNILKDGDVAFCNNRCGTDFMNALKNLERL